MRLLLGGLLCAGCLCGFHPVQAQPGDEPGSREHWFPLVMDGGGFRSHFFITNLGDVANACFLTPAGDGWDGNRFQAGEGLAIARTRVDFELAAGASLTFASGGAALFLSNGSATLDCAEPVAARLLLTAQDGTGITGMAALASSRPAANFQFPVLPELGLLSLVIANDANAPVTCSIELWDALGANAGTGSIAVDAGEQQTAALGGQVDISSGFAGAATVSCDREVAAVGLVMNDSTFTALPAVVLDGEGVGERSHILPLVADGGGFRSQLLLTNLAQGANHCLFELRGDGLTADRFAFGVGAAPDGGGASFELPRAGGLLVHSSKDALDLAFGYATLHCDGPVAASNLLSVNEAGNPVGLAVISSTGAGPAFRFPSIPEIGDMALVLSNTGSAALDCAAALQRNGGGALPGAAARIPVAAGSTAVRFVANLFAEDAVSPGFATGLVEVACGDAVSVAALPLSGVVVTAVPPVWFGAATRDDPVSALLDAAGCDDGRYLAEDANNSGLVGDCRAMVSFANELMAGGLIAEDNVLRQWGRGDQERLRQWDGVTVSSDRVRSIQLSAHGLKGAISPEIGQLSALQTLVLSNNQLSGAIPPALGRLSSLRELRMDGNGLSGSIPAEIGGLSNLNILVLTHNQLSGTIPSDLGQLSNLSTLGLHDNQLSGTIPPELGQLSNLEYLSLSQNQLSGSIPPELGGLSKLELLQLQENQLSGAFPAELGELSSLEYLALRGNLAIHGTLPWKMREPFINGTLELGVDATQITGIAKPPLRVRSPAYSENPDQNGNASHHSVKYFQGPLTIEQDYGGEPVEVQTPILGRWAMLQSNVLHEVEESPLFVAQVLDAEDQVLLENLPPAAHPTTIATAGGGWLTEYYFELPGAFFQAGNKIRHIIDPENELAETNENDNIWQPFVLYGETPPQFRVSFIPIQKEGQGEWYKNLELDPQALMSSTLALLPIADDYYARIGPGFKPKDSARTISELVELWNLEANVGEFYHGLQTEGGGVSIADTLVALSYFQIRKVIPHEFGHNFNLAHPPGCGTDGPFYPYPEGGLGPTIAWDPNWRRFASTAEDSRFRDVMSYCAEYWWISISDYHYRKASEFWLAFNDQYSTSAVSTSFVLAAGSEARSSTKGIDSLALAGRIDAAGRWSLTQARHSRKAPRPPIRDGEFTLILLDSEEARVLSEPLAALRMTDGEDAFWLARVPLPLRTARQILIIDTQGNELLREPLPDLRNQD